MGGAHLCPAPHNLRLTLNGRLRGPGAHEVPEVFVVGLLGVLVERGRDHEVQKTVALGEPPLWLLIWPLLAQPAPSRPVFCALLPLGIRSRPLSPG